MIYFIPDTHYHHHNIISNDVIIYHLGDFYLSNDEEIKNIYKEYSKLIKRGNC